MDRMAHPKIWEGSGGPPEYMVVVGMPTQRSVSGREAQQRSGRRREWLARPLKGLGGVGKPTRRSGMGWEAHLEVCEGSVGASGGPVGFGRAHPEVQERLKGPPEGEGGVGRPTRRSGKGQEAHPVVQDGSGVSP